ncbi:MAG: gliding motility-associated C-terminal domain-containing protein [Taibaiella sp.]|nr:gliding motility-associated C-terminal domain-containing protein [Taibaiella sp.]
MSSSSPRIIIYNTTPVDSFNLPLQAPTSGVEVTPVCAAQKDSTTCTSGTIIGVKKFVYSANRTLSGTSANWKFWFNGTMGSGAAAGRSALISNISSPPPYTTTGLIATLDNRGGPNSSATYTTIPTPFFCVNKPANYNPGAVDPNNDSLAFGLVAGLDAVSGIAATVTYNAGYSATAPIKATAGTFSFGRTTGQLSFTPSITQRSLVVERDSEYRHDTLVGTSMREMVVVVLNCNNPPPVGKISAASAGTIIDSTDYKVCQSADSIYFSVNPTSADSAKMTISVAGLPAGSTYTITNNGTKVPKGVFAWKVKGVNPGTYTFFLTFQDSACPLSSKQTQAYSVIILGNPGMFYSLQSAATCVKKAVFQISPTGGSPWVYKVLQGSTTVHSVSSVTSTITDSLSPGTYTFRIINADSCFRDTSITIDDPPKIYPTVSFVLPTCVGGSDGSITITGANGVSPYQYALGSGGFSSTNTFTGLSAGTYLFHVIDANSCTKDTSVVLPDPVPIKANVTFAKPPCNHFNNGAIYITAYNSVGPYQYALGLGAYTGTGTFTGLYSGSYIVHIKNGLGCIKDTIVVVPDSLKISASLALTNILCNSDSTGVITITASGAYGPPYTYFLNSGTPGSSNTFTTLKAGTYSVHVRDSEQCYFDTTVALTEPTLLVKSHSITNVDCYGNATGSIAESPTGGTSPYTYNKNGGVFVSSPVFSGLTAGTYIIGIKDNNGCIKYDTMVVTQPNLLTIASLTLVMPNCNGSSDGSYTLTPAGGTTPYSYAADGGTFGASSTLSGLAAGAHTLHIKDANDCTKDTNVTLAQPAPIVPTAVVTKSICKTLGNGKVVLTATGGTSPYTYAQGVGTYSASGTFSPLVAGTYTFHIKDAHSCIKDTIITIADSFRISETSVIIDANCYNEFSGIVVVTPAGGTSIYTYALGAGPYQTNDSLKNIHAGTYTVHVKDNNGCINDTTVTVGQPTNIIPAVAIVIPNCFGFSDGTITLTATGGTAGYTYARGAGAFVTTTLFTGIPAGAITMHVKDAHGCPHDTAFTVTQPTPLVYDSLKLSNVKCFGDSSGFVTVYANGATPPYKYAANVSAYQTTSVLTNLKVGVQAIHVKDKNGCQKDTSVALIQPTQLYLKVDSLLNPTCEKYKDGYLHVQGTGGTPSYTFAINTNAFDTGRAYPGLPEAPYALHIKDANGCIHDTSVTLVGYPHIIVNNVSVQNVSCFSLRNGAITLNITGGVQPLKYQIVGDLYPPKYLFDTSAYSAVSAWDSLIAGEYIVVTTDSKNCQKDTTVDVAQPDKLLLNAVATPNECVGPDTSGIVKIEVAGGTAPYKYLWSTNPPETQPRVSHLQNGRYMIWVNDANNCYDSVITNVVYDDCCKPYVPSAFTPNGDGLNDLFRVRFKGDMTLLDLSVYNRFGTRVYHTVYIDQGWDGKWNGVDQEIGSYFYLIKALCGNKGDHQIEMKGDVTLIR